MVSTRVRKKISCKSKGSWYPELGEWERWDVEAPKRAYWNVLRRPSSGEPRMGWAGREQSDLQTQGWE